MEPETVQGTVAAESGTPPAPPKKPRSFFKQSYKASKDYIKRIREERRPWRSALVLLAFILAAIFVDERIVRLLPDCSVRDYLFDISYVARWEFFALMATGSITGIYWYYQMKYHREIE